MSSARSVYSMAWKVRLFSLGAVLALVGIYLDNRWLTGSALVVLVGGVALRFFSSHAPQTDEERGSGERNADLDRADNR